ALELLELHRVADVQLQDRLNQRGVDATREEDRNRDVGYLAHLASVRKQVDELIDRLVRIGNFRGGLGKRPPTLDFDVVAVGVVNQIVPRLETLDVRKRRERVEVELERVADGHFGELELSQRL